MKYLAFVLIALFFVACKSGEEESTPDEPVVEETENLINDLAVMNDDGFYGETFESTEAMDITKITEQLGESDSAMVVITAPVTDVCKKKGCWIMVQNGDLQTRVTFKDYMFFMPFDITGKQVTMAGKAYYDTVSVDDLRHFAEDGGKTPEEIEAITEPAFELAFEATGVKIQ